MSDPAIERIIAKIVSVYARWGKGTSIQQMRDDWDTLFRQRAAPMDLAIFNAGGTQAAWIAMPGSKDDHILIYLHGGGFRLGSITSHLDLMQRLSTSAQARVLAVDYRLAPEHRFPAPVEDAFAAYRWLLGQGIPASSIALAGDSAGGGLAISTMLAARAADLPLPCAAVVMSAWTDMEASGASYETRATADPMHNRAMIKAMAKGYLGTADPRDPLASPLYGDLSGLPPLLIQCGDRETGLDDSKQLHDKAHAAGVASKLEIYDGMIHVFQMFAAELPQAETALESAGTFLLQAFNRQ